MNLYGQTRNAVYLSTLSRSICHKQISHHVVLSLNSSDRLTTVHLTNLRDNSGDRLVHLEIALQVTTLPPLTAQSSQLSN